MSDAPETETPDHARLRSIDVMRGLAILWVVVYHLHGFMDTRYGFAGPRRSFYEAFGDRIAEGNPWHAFTAFAELVFAMGNDGVTVFLTLSGLSLTMLTLRSGRDLDIGQFYARRVRRLLVPYWAGWALFIATIFVLAIFRTQVHGGELRHNIEFIGPYGQFSARQALDGFLLFPRGFSLVGFGAVPPSLWFVFVLLQYYLLFPLAYVLLLRIGPLAFAALAMTLSLGATYWYIAYLDTTAAHGYVWAEWWLFHPFDFAFGMSIGYWLVRRPPWLDAIVGRWPLALATAAGAIALHTLGGTIDTSRRIAWVSAYPLEALGLGIVVLLVAAAAPGRLMRSSGAKLMAWIGVISYTVLIVNDCVRLVNHYLVIQGFGYSPGWWFFIIFVYVPGTVALAYPLAAVLGLLPRAQRDVPTANGGVAT